MQTTYNSLAWILATCSNEKVRNGKGAVEHATKACEMTERKIWAFLDTLAAAGNFEQAVKWQKKVLESSDALPKEEAEKMRSRLELYEAGKPYREEVGLSR